MLNKDIQKATLAARSRTDKLIGVSVEAGKYRVEEIIPKGRTSDVIALCDPCDADSAVQFLNSLTA